MTGLIQKLFGNHNQQANGEPDSPAQRASRQTPNTGRQVHLDLPQFIVGSANSVGKQRDHNEDALFALTTNLVTGNSNLPFGLYIIADGMGGHKYGEVASDIAVRVMAGYVTRKLFSSLLSPKPGSSNEPIQEMMVNGILEANQAILKDATGGGTTLTAVLILGERMNIAHVGDSRAYTISTEGNLQGITHDHSLVKRLVDLGQITPEEASTHPQRNVLYRALGQGEPFDPDVNSSPLPKGGHILLCSDGLWGVISEEKITQVVSSAPSPQEACQVLVEAANEAGGPDNITVILIKLPE